MTEALRTRCSYFNESSSLSDVVHEASMQALPVSDSPSHCTPCFLGEVQHVRLQRRAPPVDVRHGAPKIRMTGEVECEIEM